MTRGGSSSSNDGISDGETKGRVTNRIAPEAPPPIELLSVVPKISILEKDKIPGTYIGGVKYPGVFKEDEMRALKLSFNAKHGDVFLVSHTPIRGGMQRLLTCLVEGRNDPWERDVLEKPYFAGMAASKRGADNWLGEIETWQGRRCFKAQDFPQNLPVNYPFPPEEDIPVPGLPGPKVLVIMGDPRMQATSWWEVLVDALCHKKKPGFWQHVSTDVQPLDVFQSVCDGALPFFGDIFDFGLKWAAEQAKYPGQVKLVSTGKLTSLDPREVSDVLEEIAQFLKIPQAAERARALTTNVFRPPPDAWDILQSDDLKLTPKLQGLHLTEIQGPRLQMFEEVINCNMVLQSRWKRRLVAWASSGSPFLMELAQLADGGVATLLPESMSQPIKGEAVHAQGACRPCVFAMRGTCKNTPEMCRFCHLDGHKRPKRAGHKLRIMRRLQQTVRTPSPSPERCLMWSPSA